MNNFEIYNLLGNSHSVPVLIISDDLTVVSVNDPAKIFFKTEKVHTSLEEYFKHETCKIIFDSVSQLIAADESKCTCKVQLKLMNGDVFDTISELVKSRFDNSELIIFRINITGTHEPGREVSSIDLQQADINLLNPSDEIREALNKIVSLYPLTFIGIESIRKLIDPLEEIFWLHDEYGTLVLVNQPFASSFGLKQFQMEGRQLNEFLPAYLSNFFKSVEQYVKESLTTVVLNGFPLKSFPAIMDTQLLLSPVTDNSRNVVAIAGFTVKKEREAEVKSYADNEKSFLDLLGNFPNPVALLNSSGYFKQANKEFCNFFVKKFNDLTNLKYSEVLSLPLKEKINQFISSSSDGIIIEVNTYLEPVKESPDFKLSAIKIFDEKNALSGILLVIEKAEFIDDLQQLIKRKGKMFEVLIKKNPEPIFVYDKENLKFLEVNDAALKLYGYSRDEFIQMDLTDLYSPEDIQTLLDNSAGDINEGKFGPPLKHRKKDGSSVLVKLSKIGFMFNDKEAEFNLIRDVSEDLDLKQQSHHLKLIFDNINDFIFITDPTGIITEVNNSAADKLKIPKSEIENTSFVTYGYEDDRLTINNSIYLSGLKEEISFTVNLKVLDGSPVKTNLSVYPQLAVNGEVEYYTIIGKEEIIAEPTESLQIKEIIKEVIVEKEVEPVNSDKLQIEPNFLHGVFHEILTPMNVILGFTQELAESVESLTPEQQEAVDIINQNRVTLLGTMNSIVEFTDIYLKHSRMEIGEVHITNLIEQLDNSIREITGKRDVEFAFGKISSSLKFTTDRKKMDGLLHNLIKMVSKISETKKIYFSAQPWEDNYFLVSISDRYGSISEKVLNIFDQLFIHSADPKEYGVSKLTTEISKSLLELLSGEYISFTDSNGRKENGFRFPVDFEKRTFRIPEESIDETEIIAAEIPETKIPEDITEEEIAVEDNFETELKEEPVDKTNEPAKPELNVAEEEVTIDESEIDDQSKMELTSEEASLVENDTLEDEVSTEETKIEIQDEQVSNETFGELAELPAEKISEEDLYEPESIEEEYAIEEEPVSQFDKGDKLDLSGLNCLYIEDQVDSQILFKVQMKGLKEIRFCASFEEALPVLETQRFDFIVMDINLQGEYNGLDALKIIHRMTGLESVPIIAVTAYVLPGDKEKFIATGFNDFISKPIFREKMVESLEKIFVHK